MSQCEPCNNDGHASVSSAGTCEHPRHSVHICLHPNRHRVDRRFHGERCGGRCGCGLLFCRTHAIAHAKSHGSGAADCFPNFGFSTAGPALGAAAATYARGTETAAPQLERTAIAAFLAQIDPGADVLIETTPMLVDRVFKPRDEFELPFDLLPFFFRTMRLDHVMALAARAVAQSWYQFGISELFARTTSPDVISALDTLAVWSESEGSAPTAEELSTIMSRMWAGPFDTGRAARALAEVLTNRGIPTSGQEIAHWLVHRDADEQRTQNEGLMVR